MGYIIATAVIHPDASLAVRRSVPSSPCLFDRQGQCEIDERYKDSLARTIQAKVVQLNEALLISVCQYRVQLQTDPWQSQENTHNRCLMSTEQAALV